MSRTAHNILNSPPANYFELFGLPQSFRVESATLDRQYQKLQAAFHPDKFTDADDGKRLQALQQSSLVNDAYVTLKSPLKRAAYLLKLEEVDPEEHNQAHLGEDFLLRQMVLREDLETLAGNENLEGLDAMKAEVEEERDKTLAHFESRYLERGFADAKASYNRLQFLFKLLEEIDAAEEKLLDF